MPNRMMFHLKYTVGRQKLAHFLKFLEILKKLKNIYFKKVVNFAASYFVFENAEPTMF